MKIGIDIDGVIVDTINFVAKELTEYLGREINPYEVAHEIGKIDNIDDIFEEKGDYFYSSLDPLENAVNTINKINENHEIFIISARFHLHYDITLEWIKKHGIKFSKLIFTEGKSKISVCEENGIELFVEDSIINANELADIGIKVLIYSTAYNICLDREDITRCEDWQSIREHIESNLYA